MPSAGELLRSERIQRKRALSDLAAETCISTRYLAAIEDDDAKVLPGDFYHRSFIRQYASALGIDPSETKRILSLLEPAPEINPIPALSLPQQIADAEHRSKPLAQIPTRIAATLLLVVLFGCSGLYALWSRYQETELPNEPNIVETRVENPAESQPAPQQFQPPATPQTDPGKISVNLAATENTWVSLSTAGRTLFAGVLHASQSKDFALNEDAKLLTGNAAGLDVRMNGRSLGPLGPRGQVRVVLFTQDQHQILLPRKM
jgi:cytoskeletal protein RodZ